MIGERIAYYRKQNNLTQEQLGDMLGFSNRTVSKWESGASLPGVDVLPDIASVLNVSLDSLFGIETKRDENDIEELIKETIRSELERLIPVAIKEAVEVFITDASFSNNIPEQRVLIVMNKDKTQITKTFGEVKICGPITFNGTPDRWLVNVINLNEAAVTVGDYGTKEEAEEKLLAFLNAYMSGQEAFWL